MIPIYERGGGHGIGHGLNSFIERFDSICREHVQTKRAEAFAFILYDFGHYDLRKILEDQGVFAKLDRLSGTHLSIFYLHAGTKSSIERFNSALLSKLGIEETTTTPCIVFFRLNDDRIENIEVVQLDSTSLMHGFHELYEIFGGYIETSVNQTAKNPTPWKWVRSSSEFIALEAFRALLKKAIELIY